MADRLTHRKDDITEEAGCDQTELASTYSENVIKQTVWSVSGLRNGL